jgi:hypothetical protein
VDEGKKFRGGREREKITSVAESSWAFDLASYQRGEGFLLRFVEGWWRQVCLQIRYTWGINSKRERPLCAVYVREREREREREFQKFQH